MPCDVDPMCDPTSLSKELQAHRSWWLGVCTVALALSPGSSAVVDGIHPPHPALLFLSEPRCSSCVYDVPHLYILMKFKFSTLAQLRIAKTQKTSAWKILSRMPAWPPTSWSIPFFSRAQPWCAESTSPEVVLFRFYFWSTLRVKMLWNVNYEFLLSSWAHRMNAKLLLGSMAARETFSSTGQPCTKVTRA